MENSNAQESNKQQTINDSKLELQKRFDELDKWQDERKRALDEREKTKLRMLNMEQHKIYEMMGFLDESECDESKTNKNNEKKGPKVSTNRKEPRPFLKRGEGIKQRYKIDPEKFRITNLPRYKHAKKNPFDPPKKGPNQKQISEVKKTEPLLGPQNKKKTKTLDAQEQRFQHLLFTRQNTYNSTPELKLVPSSNSKQLNENKAATSKPIPWAQVLDPSTIKPISVNEMRGGGDNSMSELDNLSMFELLEQKANEGDVNMFSNTIQVLIKRKQQERLADLPNPNDIPINKEIRESTLEPKPEQIIFEDSTCSSELEEEIESEECDSENEKVSEDELKQTANEATEVTNHELKSHVHFAQHAEDLKCETVSHDSEDTLTPTDDESDDGDAFTADKLNENETEDFIEQKSLFEHFKQALFSVLQANADALDSKNEVKEVEKTSSPVIQQLRNQCTPLKLNEEPLGIEKSIQTSVSEDLREKTELVKERLAELEKEVAIFKENNLQLMKARNELELEKAAFAQEIVEAKEKLNDERMQFEIYMHDERMKLDNDKKQAEQQLRMQKNSAKSQTRKEITELKQQIDDLQQQLKQKEQQHTAAQSRLRAHIRNNEKDQKQLQEEIETLLKEQKKLQAENVRITRDQNNKMLQEINRNIAKLAPKMAAVENNTAKVNTTEQKATKRMSPKSPQLPTTSTACHDSKNSSLNIDSETENIEKSAEIELNVCNKGKNVPIEGEFKREIFNPDGSKDILYPNGNLKKISADGMNIRMLYFNKDIKETNINEGMVKYYYASTNVWHTTYLDGLEILEFPNGQTEHRYKNGKVEVHFPNNSIKIVNPNNDDIIEEWRFSDGTHLVNKRNGDKILTLPNGQKEVHTKLNKRREYPDGTVKLVYPDGSQETRYSNGRIRFKDQDGNLLRDTAA